MDITNNIKWILISVVLFAIGHYAIQSTANNLSFSDPLFTEYASWLNILALALYFVCGAISSYLSKQKYVITGAVTGLLSASAAIFMFNVSAYDISGMFITLITGILLGAAGGVVAKHLSRRRAHAL